MKLIVESQLNEDSLDQCRNDATSICKELDKSNIWYDLVDYDMYPMNTSKVSFEVQGDWKHDHLAFKDVIYEWADKNNREIFKIDGEEIGESDSDDYTARYDVFITSDKDSYNKLNSMRGLFAEGLNPREKQIYVDAVNEAEDLEDLKDICHEIFWYDKGLFAKINKFPKDASFEDVKANMLKYLQGSTEENKNESLNESRELNYVVEPHKIDMDVYDIVFCNDHPHAGERAHSKRFTSYDDALKFIKRNAKYNNWDASPMNEDTIKTKDGKWTNKGEEGTHGKFKTKKEADAQRKAMFANGFKEGLNASDYDLAKSHPSTVKVFNNCSWNDSCEDPEGKNPDHTNVIRYDPTSDKYEFISFSRFDDHIWVPSYRLVSDTLSGLYNKIDESRYNENNSTYVYLVSSNKVYESLKEGSTKLDIIKSNKSLYNRITLAASKMPDGLKKSILLYYALPWCKNNNWLGGMSDSATNKVIYRLMDQGYDQDEIMDEIDRFIDCFDTYSSLSGQNDKLSKYLQESLKESYYKLCWYDSDPESGIYGDKFDCYAVVKAFDAKDAQEKFKGLILRTGDEQDRDRVRYFRNFTDYLRDSEMYIDDATEEEYNEYKDYQDARFESLKEDLDDNLKKLLNDYFRHNLAGSQTWADVENIDKIDDNTYKVDVRFKEEFRYDVKDTDGIPYTEYENSETYNTYKVRIENGKIVSVKNMMNESKNKLKVKEDFSDFDLINYNEFLSDNFDGWSDDIDDLKKDLNKCARVLKTSPDKLVFYIDYDEDSYAIDDLAEVVSYVNDDYSIYRMNDSQIPFICCTNFSDSYWIFKNEQQAIKVVSAIKEYTESLNENLKLEGLVDITNDFRSARESWNDIYPDIDFDLALERWNKESKLAEPGWFAKPIYSVAAWEDMVQMFSDDLKDTE